MPAETWSKGLRLGSLAAVMVVLGYPGEVATAAGTKWFWWAAAMVPFLIIVFELYNSLDKAITSQPAHVQGLIRTARNLTVMSWCFYPIVFVLPMIGLAGDTAATAVQVGYTIADVVAKAVFGILIYLIAVRKSSDEAHLAEGVVTA